MCVCARVCECVCECVCACACVCVCACVPLEQAAAFIINVRCSCKKCPAAFTAMAAKVQGLRSPHRLRPLFVTLNAKVALLPINEHWVSKPKFRG
jgi:hypothetical protein